MAKANPSAAVKKLKFEDAIEQVESVIDQIESGDIGLEQSLADYERATKLIAHCRSILDVAEKRIVELTVDDQGRLKAVNAEVDDAGA
jgi:exodeoxyribonuclease VII small subunit